ncbi:heat shock 70 kDa protein 12A-like [Mercenaria mercenaria]|uniref:heat shock 70 kDa protein 12A-like n=1 Tax=Mercenaria mercenaria TaxID=6596 RepID=UPI00234ECF26|nr:heat shock 70 kDa protein 12A-like [Mercenaria mercenaria]
MTEEKSSKCTRLLVAAMDFGTTYSGYAFSFRNSPNDIHANPSWVAGSEKLISLKCPTAVLLKPNKEFHSFGFEAENKYADLSEDNVHHGWYLFRRFKMALYETKKLQLDTPVEDISGKKLPAIDIFSHSIRFLKNHLWKTIQTRTTGILETDIEYVITVPAIWDERAKQFMRRAANKANIPNNQVTLALEPEAASIWCQVVTDDELSSLSEPLAKYMVVDLGGGTADITVHQKMDNGNLKELYTASGGAWGGNEVDKANISKLSDIVGSDAMENFKRKNMSDYFDLLREFETKKRTITTDTDGKIRFKIPITLREFSESDGIKLQDRIAKLPSKTNITCTGDKIKIEKVAAKALFDYPLNMLMAHLREIFADPKVQDVETVLLVGGFGECELVKEAFEKHFANKRLLIPPDAGIAVLKGAVRFGHLQDIVSNRIARFTIGRETITRFEEQDDPAKKQMFDGVEKCVNKFFKMVEIGEEIPRYKFYEEKTEASFAEQTDGMISLFSSTERIVRYTTEPKCQELGRLTFEFPNSTEISDKKVTIHYCFGDTEIHIRVKLLKTNEEHEKWIDCFSS